MNIFNSSVEGVFVGWAVWLFVSIYVHCEVEEMWSLVHGIAAAV